MRGLIFMAQYCPLIKQDVLYTACIECEDRKDCQAGLFSDEGRKGSKEDVPDTDEILDEIASYYDKPSVSEENRAAYERLLQEEALTEDGKLSDEAETAKKILLRNRILYFILGILLMASSAFLFRISFLAGIVFLLAGAVLTSREGIRGFKKDKAYIKSLTDKIPRREKRARQSFLRRIVDFFKP